MFSEIREQKVYDLSRYVEEGLKWFDPVTHQFSARGPARNLHDQASSSDAPASGGRYVAPPRPSGAQPPSGGGRGGGGRGGDGGDGGGKKPPKVHTKKSRLKDAGLPREGRVRFVPPRKWRPSEPLKQDPGTKGYEDKFGNLWCSGKSRTENEPIEWDVILSKRGQLHLGHLSRDGKHLNVSMRGRITH